MESAFISCDWGTSSFRLRLIIGKELGIGEEILGDQGIRDVNGQLTDASSEARNQAFAQVLGRAADQLSETHPQARTLPIFVSGMASSSIGWKELPYAQLPFALSGETLVYQKFPLTTPNGNAYDVILASGIASETEIMRGEECELIGVGALETYRERLQDCRIVLPGTHSKHVIVRNHQIVDFQTALTGELFDVLSKHSILASSVSLAQSPTTSDPELRNAFRAGVDFVHQTGLIKSLFRVRTRQVLQHTTAETNSQFLSGLLIGAELNTLATAPNTDPILLLAAPKFADAYLSAADVLGLSSRVSAVTPNEVARAAVRGQATLLKRIVPIQP